MFSTLLGKRMYILLASVFALLVFSIVAFSENNKLNFEDDAFITESSSSAMPPAFTFYDPSGAATTSYILDTLCKGETRDHCILVESESTDHNIINISGNVGTVIQTPATTPFDTCYSYTAPFGFTGFDTVTFTVENLLGNTADLEVIYLVVDPDTPIDAGAPQELCSLTEGTLSAVNPDPYANGYWVVNSGGSTVTDPTSPTSAVTDLQFGSNIFLWYQEYPCGETNIAVTQISVFDGAAPPALAGPDAFLCSDDNQYVMQANDPGNSVQTVWEATFGTATVSNIFDSNTLVYNIGIGENKFKWNIDNGPCPGGATVDSMYIYVYDQNQPDADAGPDQSICSTDFIQADISANAPNQSNPNNPATGVWELFSGSGIIDDVTQPSTFITGCDLGDNVFTWSIDNGPCGTTVDTLVITIFDGDLDTVIDAGPDTEYCLPTTNHFMSANSFVYPAEGNWIALTPGNVITTINDPNTEVTNLSVGDNTFVWQSINGPCDTPGTEVTDTVNIVIYDAAQMDAAAGPDLEFCETGLGNVPMTANAAPYPASGLWTIGDEGSAIFEDDTDHETNVTGLSIGNNELIWTIDNGPCGPTTADTLNIVVFPASQISADAGDDQHFCTPISTYDLMANQPPYPSTGQWTLQSGFGSFDDANDPNTTLTGLAPGVSVFRWTILNGPCPGTDNFDEITITIYDENALDADAGNDFEICSDSANDYEIDLDGSELIFPQTGVWTILQGGGSFSDFNDPNPTVTNPPVGENIYRWTVTNGPCTNGNSESEITVTVYPDYQDAADAGEDQDICSNVASTTLEANEAIFPNEGTWIVLEGNGVFNDDNDPNTIVSGLDVGVNRFQWTIDNGECEPNLTTSEVQVTVYNASQFEVDAGDDIDVCSDINNVTLDGNTPLDPATGEWQLTSTGTGVFVDETDPTTEVSGMDVGENIFVWVVTNGPCLSEIMDSVSVFVFDDNAPAAFAGDDQEICLDDNTTSLTANSAIFPALGTWTVESGSANVLEPNNPNSAVDGLGLGENVLRWTIDNDPCVPLSTTDLVSIFVFDDSHPVADAGDDQEFCTPISTATLDANAVTFPTVGYWEIVSSSGTITNSSNPSSTVTGLDVGEHVFRWNIENGPCSDPNSFDEVTILIFDASQLDANAGEDQALCLPPDSQTNLEGNSIIFPAVGTWTQTAGNAAIIDDINDPNTLITGLTVGTYEFQWEIDNGACGALTSDLVTIEVFDDSAEDADAGLDQEICTPINSTNLAANSPIQPGIGTWTSLGVAIVDDPNDPNTLVNGLAIGDNLFEWEIDNNACSGGVTVDTVNVILFFDGQLDANAGPIQAICTPTNTVTMEANSYSYPATGYWTQTTGTPATIVDILDPETQITDLDVGINTFVWTIENGACSNTITTSEVTIQVFNDGAPPSDAGDDQELCSPTTSTNMTADPAEFPGVGTWSLFSGAGNIIDENDPNTEIDGLEVGINTFVWSLDYSTCGTQSDTVNIYVYDSTVEASNAGIDQEFCTPVNSTTMDATPIAFPGFGTWSLFSGNGTISDVNDPNAEISNLLFGENIFVWEVYNGDCLDPALTTDTMSIFIFNENQADAVVGDDQSQCTPIDFTTLTGNEAFYPAIGTWSTILGAGTFTNENQHDTEVTSLAVGENRFVWTIDNGPCSNGITMDTLSVFLFDGDQNVAEAGDDQEFCTPFSSTNLNANTVIEPGVGTWSILSDPTGISIIDFNNPNTVVSGLGIGQHVFQWNISASACGPASSDVVSIFVYNQFDIEADAGEDIAICLPETSVILDGNNPIFPSEGTWTALNSGTIDSENNPATMITDLEVGENLFVWSVDNGPCGNSTDTVSVFVFDNSAEDAFAGLDQSICTPESTVILEGNMATNPGIGTWTTSSLSASISDPNDPSSEVTGLTVGEHIFTWEIDNGPCGISADQVTILVYDANQTDANAGIDQDICLPFIVDVTMDANDLIFPAIGTWTALNSGDIVDAHNPETEIQNLEVGLNYFVWTVDNGACNNGITTDTILVNVFDDSMEMAQAGDDQEYCLPDNFTTLIGSPLIEPATGLWTQISGGSATISSPTSNETEISDLEVGIYEFVWSVENGPCWSSTDTMQVTIFDEVIEGSEAGEFQEYCTPVSSTFMEANTPTFPATGEWVLITSEDPGSINIVDPTNPNTEVTGLPIGENTFAWVIYNGPCSVGDPLYFSITSVFIFDENQAPADAGENIEICLPIDFTNMDANIAGEPAIGIWDLVGGDGTINNLNDPNTLIENLEVGTNSFEWTINNGACPNNLTTDTVDILVFQEEIPQPYAGDDQFFCSPVSSTSLEASALLDPNTGYWTVAQGTGSFSNETSIMTDVEGMSVGINRYVWNVYNGPCTNSLYTDTVDVYVYDSTHPDPYAGEDIELCMPNNQSIMFAEATIIPAIGTWTFASGSGTIVDPNDPNSLVTDLELGYNELVWSIDNGPCEELISDTVLVTVFEDGADLAEAGDDIEICTPNSCVTLNAALPSIPTTGTWTFISGAATIDDIHDPNAEVCALGVGIYDLQWLIYNGPCDQNNSFDLMSIYVYDDTAPDAFAGEDIMVCLPADTVWLSADEPVYPAQGTWTQIEGTGTIGNTQDHITSFTDLTPGIHEFQWSVDNGPCGTTLDTVIVQINDPNTPLAYAGEDQFLCDFEGTQFEGSDLIYPATGEWTVLSTISEDLEITFPSEPNSTLFNLGLGVNIFQWTVDNGACGISTDTLLIYQNDIDVAEADAGPDITLCGALDEFQMQGSVTIGNTATGTWTLVSGDGIISDIDNEQSLVYDIPVGYSEFAWTVDNLGCGISSDTMSFLLFDPELDSADVGEDLIVCEHEFVPFSLPGDTIDYPAFAYWEILDGEIEIDDPNDPAAIVSDLGTILDPLIPIENQLLWTVDNGVCGIFTDTLNISYEDCLYINLSDAFSPNGDGINDFYEVPNLSNYPENSIVIFNRWGDQVYTASPYMNDWDGKSQTSAFGEDLPVGTYYIILDLKDGTEPLTGFIYLKR